MAVKYKVLELGNALQPAQPKKFYARQVSSGDITLRELSKDIANASSLTVGDVHNVLDNLIDMIPKYIADGKIVRLGDFGSYYLTITSNGESSANQVTSNSIKKNKLNFRPGKAVKDQLAVVTYEKDK
jgi:predicted histone-like DNA-binding protein